MKLKRPLVIASAIAVLAVLLISAAVPVQGYFDPTTGFATEVVLNKDGITYDLDKLEEKAKDLGVKVIVVEEEYKDYDDTPSSTDQKTKDAELEEGGGEAVSKEEGEDASGPEEMEKVEGGEDAKEVPPWTNYLWEPGTYYIYQSHYDPGLAVVLQDIDEAYYDMDGEEVIVSGLSIVVAIQIKWEEVEYRFDSKYIMMDGEAVLDESASDLMTSLGWGGYYEKDYEIDMMYMTKGDATILITSGEGGKTPDGPSETGQTFIWVNGPGDSISPDVDSDVKTLLDHLGFNDTMWDDVEMETTAYSGWGPAPKGNITPEELDWGAAVSTEIEWLRDNGVVKGVTQGDIDAISNVVGPGSAGYNSRVYFDNGAWVVNPYPGFRELIDNTGFDAEQGGAPKEPKISGGTIFTIDLDNLPGGSSSVGPGNGGTLEAGRLIIALLVIPVIIVILAIMALLGFTRLRRNSLLANLNRRNIYEAVKKNEGIHFNGLMEELDLKPGVLSHHLNILENEEFIKSKQDGKYRRFFLYETKSELKIYLTTVQQRILQTISDSPGISQSGISKDIGASRMIVNYHLKILKDAGIVSVEKTGRESQCYKTSLADAYLPG